MKKRLAIVLGTVLAVAAVVIGARLLQDRRDNGRIVVSGNIEVTQVDAAFKIAGRLQARLVDEGEAVRAGQLIARLDPIDETLRVRQAEAERDYARAVLAELEAGSRAEEIGSARARVAQAEALLEELEHGSRAQEIADAEAELSRAQAAAVAAASRVKLASDDLRRYAALVNKGGVSRQAYETVRTRHETEQNAHREALAQVESARQQLSLRREGPRSEEIRRARGALEQAREEYALVLAGPRAETIAQARARAAAAEQNLQLARQRLADTRLNAPFDGVVLSKSAEPGAYLTPGSPVLTLAELRRVWLRAYVSERDLGRIKRGQAVTVTTDAWPEKTYPGRISFISSEAEFTPKSVQTFEERIHLMYRIKVDLENPDGDLKPGMPADGAIALSP